MVVSLGSIGKAFFDSSLTTAAAAGGGRGADIITGGSGRIGGAVSTTTAGGAGDKRVGGDSRTAALFIYMPPFPLAVLAGPRKNAFVRAMHRRSRKKENHLIIIINAGMMIC